jgi:flagellar motility protein MotE (MotC chaperone)
MKNIIVASLVFAVAFVAVTALIIMANWEFRNIWDFDFTTRPVKKVVTHKVTFASKDYWKIEKYMDDTFKPALMDTLHKMYFKKKIDTVYEVIVKDKSLLKTIDKAMKEVLSKDKVIKQKDNQIKRLEDEKKALKKKFAKKIDEDYIAWVKNNAKLLSSLDPARASKILQIYSDNVAHDLIYAMKKKKAAEILSYLTPQQVAKITRSK